MLNESELSTAKLLYDLLFIHQQFGYRDLHEFDDLCGRASKEQLEEIAYANKPEDEARAILAAERGEWRGRGPVYSVPMEALRPIEDLQELLMAEQRRAVKPAERASERAPEGDAAK